MNPRVSFVIIAYNEERNIRACLEAVLRQRAIPNVKTEIIVVDDGSADSTATIVSAIARTRKQVRLVQLGKNRGRGAAREAGIKASRGEAIAFVDADIRLPSNWLPTVWKALKNADAAGGIAMPDGDGAYIANTFHLRPKAVPTATGITGNNCIYRKPALAAVPFNPSLRGGEETDVNWRMEAAGFRITLVPTLHVEHREDITFRRSLSRMFGFGKGATRLLFRFGRVRNADLSFFGFLLVVAVNIIALGRGQPWLGLAIPLYVFFIGYAHLLSKFEGELSIKFLLAGLTNAGNMASYFIGRLAGFVVAE